MTLDEGYIKYTSRWTPGPPIDAGASAMLERWRRPLFAAGLIGYYDDLDVGYGNLSIRCGEPGQFLISGTQTGRIARTTPDHYALVTAYDIEENEVACTGPVQASSEAMTHAAIYELSESIDAVVHVHSRPLWDRHLNRLRTAAADVAYGTPAMAKELTRLYCDTKFSVLGVAVMAGHEEGLIGFGTTLAEATGRILDLDRR